MYKNAFFRVDRIRFMSYVVLLAMVGCGPSLDTVQTDYQKTVEAYQEKLAVHPKDQALRLEFAQFFYQLQNFTKVVEVLGNVETEAARILAAKSYCLQGDYDSALELFEKVGEEGDPYYTYLFARTLEEKNLFPRAVRMYKKIKGPYEEEAEKRIAAIGLKIEDTVPEEIVSLIAEEKAFVEGIDKEGAVYLLFDEGIRVKPDNTTVSTVHFVEQILNEKGKSEEAEIKIGYDATYERVELEYARVITPDGKVIYAGKENIRDVTKYLDYPLYSNAKVLIISMPAVEVGALLDCTFKTYSSKMANKDDFTYTYRLRERFPVARASFQLICPKGKPVHFRYINAEYASGIDLAPHKENQRDTDVYTWEFTHIEPIIPEAKMPPVSLVNPAIVMSSFASWDEVYEWWYALFKDKTELTKEVKAFIQELVKGAQTDVEKIKRIYKFCTQDVRYVAVEYGESGYEPHKAVDVFWNRYGDCKDKATLIVAMLKEAGIEASPVLIPTKDAYQASKDFPAINFNHAIAAVKLEGKLIFMDGTSATTAFFDLPPGDQERTVFVCRDDGYEVVDTPQLRDNGILYEMKIAIDEAEDATVTRSVHGKGFFASYLRYYYKYTHPQEIKEELQARALDINPFAKLDTYSIENVDDFEKLPGVTYTFNAKRFLNRAGRLRIVPPLSMVDVDVAYVGSNTRQFPIAFPGVFEQVSTVTITVPEQMAVEYLPDDQHVATKWFEFTSSGKQEGNTLLLERRFSVAQWLVSQEEYAAFKKALEDVLYLLREEVILQKR